jgi:lysophospholipase L1-like esterase
LYRIQNGGIGVLDPDVWWVLIGINDLTDDFCNVDAIVAANIAVVEEIISLRPKATVVINSLLPRTPTFWVYLSQINERLKCYAAMTYQVEFFNATDIFMLSDGTLRNLPDDVHPDAEGSRIWGEEIVQEVLNLIGY